MANTTYKFSPNYNEMKFGVELEMLPPSGQRSEHAQHKLAELLNAAGIPASLGWYQTSGHWGIKGDVSVKTDTGWKGLEAVSPILYGTEGLATLEKVLRIVNEAGFSVNATCGLHVHHDASDIGLKAMRYLTANYIKFEGKFDVICGRGTTPNVYIRGIRGNLETVKDELKKIKEAEKRHDLTLFFPGERYHKLNLEAKSKHNTIEFRHMEGTLDFMLIASWVKFTHGMMHAARDYAKGALKSSCYVAAGIDSDKNAMVWLPVGEKPERAVIAKRIKGKYVAEAPAPTPAPTPAPVTADTAATADLVGWFTR